MDENIGYNGAYSGAEIDAAIGAVKNKETTWDGKQDKLTGVQGQVVGFDDEGDAVAMPAPDTGVTTFNGRTGAVTPASGDYTADMVGARPDNWLPTTQEINAVPTSRTVNGHALDANITLEADDVGARPNTWTPSATDVGAIPASQKGANNGIAELDSTGRVPSSQLPSYVDDVLEYDSLTSFPQTGEDGKIYVAEDTNRQYRWSGSQYVEISPSLALGETSSTAYRGDRGATAYTHSQTTGNPHNTTAAEVGAVPTSRTVNGHALSDNISLTADDVGARPTSWTPTATDVGAATPADVEAVKPFKVAITIPTSGWSDNQQTFTVTGVPADPQNHEVKLATVGATNTQALMDAGLCILDEAANSLTLKVSTVPTASFQVYAIITPLQ